MVKKFGIIASRLYSTHSVGSNIDEIGLNKKPLEFASHPSLTYSEARSASRFAASQGYE